MSTWNIRDENKRSEIYEFQNALGGHIKYKKNVDALWMLVLWLLFGAVLWNGPFRST